MNEYDKQDINRLGQFIAAQDKGDYGGYERALSEIRAGRKTTHWIWYVFPQLRGRGSSYMCDVYGIDGRKDAVAYLNDPVLCGRLREITEAMLSHAGKLTAEDILGKVDADKVCACWTLFHECAANKSLKDLFGRALTEFYGGVKDRWTASALSTEAK